MKQVRKIAGVVAASAVLFAGSVVADGRTDFFSQSSQLNYFNTPENARTIGMAGSSVATSSDSSSVVGNPAGLGFMKDADVSVSYYRNDISGNEGNFNGTEVEVDGGSALASLPIVPTLDGTPRYGSVGFGWTGFKGDVDDSAGTDYDNYSINLAYGKDLSDQLALGYSVAYSNNEIENDNFSAEMDDGVRQEVGMQYKTSKTMTLGASTHYGFGEYDYDINNANGGNINANNAILENIAAGDVSNWGADVGFGKQMGMTLLTGSLDYNLYDTDIDDFYAWSGRVGIEQTITNWLKARVGYRYTAIFDYDRGFENDNSKYNAVSFGVGVKLAKYLMADYGAEYRHSGDDDWLHAVTLSVPFSLCNN